MPGEKTGVLADNRKTSHGSGLAALRCCRLNLNVHTYVTKVWYTMARKLIMFVRSYFVNKLFKSRRQPKYEMIEVDRHRSKRGFIPSKLATSIRIPADSVDIPQFLYEYGSVLTHAQKLRLQKLRRTRRFDHPMNIVLMDDISPSQLKPRRAYPIGAKYIYHPQVIVRKTDDSRTERASKKR